MHTPQKLEINLIKEIDLLGLIAESTEDMTPYMFNEVCNFGEQRYSLSLNCVKTKNWGVQFNNDRDIIIYLVNRELLPEGDYLVIVE